MKTKISELKSIISVILGLMLISTAILAYWGNLQYVYELTFLSNIATGFIFTHYNHVSEKMERDSSNTVLGFCTAFIYGIPHMHRIY
jgi:hypothetical protein